MVNNGYTSNQMLELVSSNMGYYSYSPLQVVDTRVKTPGLLKSVYTTDFFYNPPFGRPRFLDYVELEPYENNVYIKLVVNHLIDSITQTDWDIVGVDEEKEPPKAVIKELEDFFEGRNWIESWESGLRRMLPDLILYDCGVFIKIFAKKDYDKNGELKNKKAKPIEIMARDGRSFLKDMSVHGKIIKYWQYSWMSITGKPVSFAADEIVYLQMRPQSRSPYGTANLEVVKNVVDYLTAAITAQRAFFENGMFPGGSIDFADVVDIEELKKRAQLMKDQLKGEGNMNKWLISSGGTKVTPLQFTSQQSQWIQGSEYLAKIIFGIFKVPATELGFTEGQNRSVSIQQSSTYKVKGVKNILSLLENYINREIIWRHFSTDVKFVFDRSLDLQDLTIRTNIDKINVDTGLVTINEIRKRDGKETFEDDFFDAPFAADVAREKIMSGGEGEGGEMPPEGEEPGVMPGEEETPEEVSVTPTGGVTETREEAEKIEKATNVGAQSGDAGYALAPVVIDAKKKKKEKDIEDGTVKDLADVSDAAHKEIEKKLAQLYEE
jgi:HK97 family phage portal protein